MNSRASNWGCQKNYIRVVVTDKTDTVMLPAKAGINKNMQKYTVSGFTSMSSELPLHTVADPIEVHGEEEYRIWYTEDLYNYTENDNDGIVKTDVYAIII